MVLEPVDPAVKAGEVIQPVDEEKETVFKTEQVLKNYAPKPPASPTLRQTRPLPIQRFYTQKTAKSKKFKSFEFSDLT